MRQNLEQGLMTSGQPVKRGTMAHEHDVYAMLADIAALQRDADALRQYAPRAEELAARDEHKLYLAIAHRARGVAHRLSGEHAEAERRLERALSLFRELGAEWQAGRTLCEMGELARKRRKTARAREAFTEALAVFRSLNAKPDVDRTQEALQGL